MTYFQIKLTKLSYLRSIAVIVLTFLWVIPALGDDENPWEFLPTRLLEIEGGTVAFQSALIVDTRQPLNNPMLQKYPTKYILPTTNEADFPIWVEVEWRIPGTNPFLSSAELQPGEYGLFFRNIKKPMWDTPIPVTTTVYSDGQKMQQIGGREIRLQFEGGTDKDAFLSFAKTVNKLSARIGRAHGRKIELPLLPGFQEMELSEAVPGTMADPKLMEDIQLLLWKYQSKRHWDCAHAVHSVEPYDPSGKPNFDNLSAEAKHLIEEGRMRGDIAFEEWRIESCDRVSSYLVLMGRSPTGGTDLIAVNLGEVLQ